MTFQNIDAIYEQMAELGELSWEYWKKQMHRVPEADSQDRAQYLKGVCQGKIVLHVGCIGPLDEALKESAIKVYGIDREVSGREDYHAMDLDTLAHTDLPVFPAVNMIICGEVIEHLSNPGWFLKKLKETYPDVPVVITVPNATAHGLPNILKKRGIENVNTDHVAYYSYTTLKELLRRHNYAILSWHWYNGPPYFAEGLIVLAK